MNTQPIDAVPLWALYPLTVAAFLIVFLAGFYFARGRGRRLFKNDRGVGAISGATLGLLAFLLAFVVGFGMTVWQERRAVVVSEANAIGTAYLRAGYLDEPYSGDSRALLAEYTDQRVAVADSPDNLSAAKARSEEIHGELWQMVEEIVKGGSTAATTGLYVAAINDVIDIHTERVNIGLYIRIPPLTVVLLFVFAAMSLFVMGMQLGYTENRSLVAPIALLLVLAAVLYLIVDIDRAGQGLLQVPNQALYDLRASLPTLP